MNLSADGSEVTGLVFGEAYSAAVAVVMWAGRRAVQVLWSGPPSRAWAGDRTCTGLSTGRHLHSLPGPAGAQRRVSGTGAERRRRRGARSWRGSVGDEVGYDHRLVTVRTGSARAKATAEGVALLATLDAEVAGLTQRTFVDDRGLGEGGGEHDDSVSWWLTTEAVAAGAAGVRAPDAGPAGSGLAEEGEATGRAGALAVNRHGSVTHRGSAPARGDAGMGP